ncbi:MAG: acyl-CoA dehydrogenase family protein [Burkholderiales bacterium]
MMLEEAADRLFAAHRDSPALWDELAKAGFDRPLAAGLELSEALSLLFAAGRHALPAPLAETILAGWLLASAGLPQPEGRLTVAPVREGDSVVAKRDGARWSLLGKASRVPWATGAAAIVVVADGAVVLASPGDCRITAGTNLAGEPRDDVEFAGAAAEGAPSPVDAAALRALGAVMRSAQIAGALQAALETSVRYATERAQFGRPIGRFQAVQQNLAVLAGQAAAATAAAQAAIEACAHSLDSRTIAAAKIRTGEAASLGAAIAHQVHGAIGFTQEYPLNRLTRRLWSWRDEFGNESHWARVLGGAVAAAGPARLWTDIAGAEA